MTSPLVPIISPSILSSDFAFLGQEVQRMIDLGADAIHVDVMDGHFVQNITLGPPIVKSLRNYIGPKPTLDCHLMVSRPENWIDAFSAAGASSLTVHVETFDVELGKHILEKIKSTGLKAALALKPGTPVEAIIPYMQSHRSMIDMVLVMTVEPGFGGQAFMKDMMPKVNFLRSRYSDLNIQVDGGLTLDTIDTAAKAGANVIVAGSAIYQAQNPKEVIRSFKDTVSKCLQGS